jgi:hypothetical protein
VLLQGQDGLRVGLLPYVLRAPAPVLLNMAHRDQWSAMIEWAAGTPLPCRVTRGANLYPLCFFRPADASWLVAVANLSADDAVDSALHLSFQPRRVERLAHDGSWQPEDHLIVTVPAFSLAAWRLFV